MLLSYSTQAASELLSSKLRVRYKIKVINCLLGHLISYVQEVLDKKLIITLPLQARTPVLHRLYRAATMLHYQGIHVDAKFEDLIERQTSTTVTGWPKI